jgi:hypothetical protein
MATKEEIREKFLTALPHFRFAMKEASRKGKAKIGVLSITEDGGGKVIASFEAEEFFDDLAILLDAPPQTKEDDLEAAAVKLVQSVKRGIVDLG